MAPDAPVRKPVRIAKSRYAGVFSALTSGRRSLVKMLVQWYAPDEVNSDRNCRLNKELDLHQGDAAMQVLEEGWSLYCFSLECTWFVQDFRLKAKC